MSSTNKAFLISIALHLALLIALASLRPHFELGVGADRKFVEVALVESLGVLESPTAESESAAESASEPSVETPTPAEAETQTEPAPPARQLTDVERDPEPQSLADAEAATAADPQSLAEAEPATADGPLAEAEPTAADGPQSLAEAEPVTADETEPEATPPVPEFANASTDERPVADDTVSEDTATDEPIEQTASAGETLPAERSDRGPTAAERDALESTATASTATEAATTESVPAEPVRGEPVETAEAALIEKRIERWARGFAALGEWETATSWSRRGTTYSAEVSHVPNTDGSGYDEAIVTVTAERDGRKLSTELRMQRLGFSHYAQFVDRWDPQVQVHDDRIDGRFHSNSEIYVGRTGGVQPTFLGKVTTATRVNTSRSHRSVRRSQVFLGGLEERVGRIPLPKSALLAAEGELDAEHSLLLESDSRIRFLADGTLAWNPAEQPDNRSTITLDPEEPFHIVAGDDVAVHVSGTVNGRVLLYSADDIVIEGDLVYAAHPLESSSSDDYLGLVAESRIDVAEPSITGPGDLEIHAAIYARSRFAVRSFRSQESGTLTIIGSLTAGSLSATEPRFATDLRFDPRLAEVRPPGFPVTDRYEIAEWDGRWSLASESEATDAAD